MTSLGVSVFFEEENIHSETLTTELMVSVFGALAQQESVSISQNQRISYQRRMERGEFITCTAPLGYQLMDRKRLEVDKAEAEIVRWIFHSYLSGHSAEWIAEELTKRDVPTARGKGIWREQTVRKILENEKYVGDALCQKTYTSNILPFERKENKGFVDQYYIENAHPAIIDREAFARTQALTKLRADRMRTPTTDNPLAKKIICQNCGTRFIRRKTAAGYTAWVCRKHNVNAGSCSMGWISEQEIHAAFMRMYNKLRLYGDVVLSPALSQLHDLNDALQRENPAMLSVNKAIAEAAEQSHKLNLLQSRGLLDDAARTARQRTIETKLTELRRERRRLRKNEDLEEVMEVLQKTIHIIRSGPERLEKFDEILFSGLIENITAKSQTCICFQFCGGIQLTERLSEAET